MGVNSGIPSFTNIMAQFSWHAMVFTFQSNPGVTK